MVDLLKGYCIVAPSAARIDIHSVLDTTRILHMRGVTVQDVTGDVSKIIGDFGEECTEGKCSCN